MLEAVRQNRQSLPPNQKSKMALPIRNGAAIARRDEMWVYTQPPVLKTAQAGPFAYRKAFGLVATTWNLFLTAGFDVLLPTFQSKTSLLRELHLQVIQL
jgi:hypothetical protein